MNEPDESREGGREEDGGESLVADEPPPEATLEEEHEERRRPAAILALFALGIVYGDIGTSPIYALRESFHGPDSVAVNDQNVQGVLSLIFWSLLLVISLKYLYYIMRAENDGEGGILALASLLDPWRGKGGATAALGLFGAALLYGDGMITPAISVLSAVEGLEVVAPEFERWVIPVAVSILVALFALQRRGTIGVGSLFGPVVALWFLTLAALGVWGIIRNPSVLAAADPRHAVRFFGATGGQGFLVLGTVFLVVTGGEAMYADLGHFGARPIRLGWFTAVLPALLLNYFGQGSLLLAGPGSGQPFYELAPGWGLVPLVALATAATVIASQAVISGVFSLTRQAIQLGRSPRFLVEQTSEENIGRVYVPAVNWGMMVATVGLVLGFRSSSALAAAYGVAVSATFVITTLLAYRVSRERWNWAMPLAVGASALFLVVDLAFFGANMTKFVEGGWFPLVVAALIYLVMSTWGRGRTLLERRLSDEEKSVDELLDAVAPGSVSRVAGTGVFLTRRSEGIPPTLVHHLRRNGALQETALLLTILTSNVPRVPFRNRLDVEELGEGLYRVVAHYGFMQSPNAPVIVETCRRMEIPVADEEEVTYYVGRQVPVPEEETSMGHWRARLYNFMHRNSRRVDASYNIPSDRVVELGVRVPV